MLRSVTKCMTSAMRPFTLAIEGNIGCGKTTFLKHFEDSCGPNDILTAVEPVAKWQNLRGHNLLQLMYEDSAKWGFTFQSYVQLTMLESHHLSGSQPFKLMERSLHSSRYCFIENLRRSGSLCQEQTAVLDEFYQWQRKAGLTNVDLIVYLQTPPETSYHRLKRRGRFEEATVPLKLLQDIHDRHEDWLVRGAFPKIAPVLILDASRPLAEMPKEYDRCKFLMKRMRKEKESIPTLN